jgi:signal transduction histidine kinase
LHSELRTPLNGIIGIAELLSHTELTSEQKEHIVSLKTCSRALLNNINDVCYSQALAMGTPQQHR